MNRDYMYDYVNFSIEFKKSNGSRESVEKLRRLMHQLEGIDRGKDDTLLLSNIYTLLGDHQSAYEAFKTIADENNPKDSFKLYFMSLKTNSPQTSSAERDTHPPLNEYSVQTKEPETEQEEEDATAEEKQPVTIYNISEMIRPASSRFDITKEDEDIYLITHRDVVIFNKRPKEEKISVNIPTNDSIDAHMGKIKEHLEWLGRCKGELIDFYNNQAFEEKADESWYNSLEVFRVMVILDERGNIFTSVSGSDKLWEDHVLDIEIDNTEVISMNYNG